MFSLSSANSTVLQFVKLLDSTCDMQYIITAFQKVIKIYEQSIWREFPFSFGLGLIFKISIFKFGAHVYSDLNSVAGLLNILFILHILNNSLSRDIL